MKYKIRYRLLQFKLFIDYIHVKAKINYILR